MFEKNTKREPMAKKALTFATPSLLVFVQSPITHPNMADMRINRANDPITSGVRLPNTRIDLCANVFHFQVSSNILSNDRKV